MKDKILENAIDFNQKGMKYYVEKDVKHALTNIAIASELLGKAFLPQINPCLIIDKDFDSLLHACGMGEHARKSPATIRTIGAKEVFIRCIQIIPKLKDFEVEMGLLSDLRNGALHFAGFEHGLAKKLFIPYLKVAKILSEAMKLPLANLFGAFNKLAEASIQESAKEINIEVERLIAKAKIDFQKKFEGTDETLKKNIIKSIMDGYVLTQYEEDLIECPACGSNAIISGSSEVKEWEADYDDDGTVIGVYPILKLYANSLKCNICGLKLNTSEELEAAGIDTMLDVEDVDPSDFYEPYFDDIGD